jgi:hypothetical protein
MADTRLTLSCADAGATLAVSFAAYGTPTGACPAFARGACDAAGAAAAVRAACDNRSSCVVFPNTTSFGDPCFGTAKLLAVVASCSSGAGAAACSDGPPPAPQGNFTAAVSVDFSRATATVRAVPSVQVVSQARLWRGAPTHDAAFATLAALGARRARFVPWVPYAAYGVGELSLVRRRRPRVCREGAAHPFTAGRCRLAMTSVKRLKPGARDRKRWARGERRRPAGQGDQAQQHGGAHGVRV